MPDVAFVLFKDLVRPEPRAIVREAQALGVELEHVIEYVPDSPAGEGGHSGPLGFALRSGGHLLVMYIEVPHPDVPGMATGPLSPEPEALRGSPAHAIVTALDLPGDGAARERVMAILTGAVVRATGAVGAMLGHHILFQRGETFAAFAELAAEHDELPLELAVDITAAGEPDGRLSFLTHGMTRYGREEIFVTCSVTGRGAFDFFLSIARWLYGDRAKELPTGDTVGRSEHEKVQVQRVPNPTGEGPPVIRLDLDVGSTPPRATKKSWS